MQRLAAIRQVIEGYKLPAIELTLDFGVVYPQVFDRTFYVAQVQISTPVPDNSAVARCVETVERFAADVAPKVEALLPNTPQPTQARRLSRRRRPEPAYDHQVPGRDQGRALPEARAKWLVQ